MLKITSTHENGRSITLKLDGNLNRATVQDLERLCSRYRTEENRKVILDFSGVIFIDTCALERLRLIKDDRVEMVNGSPFVETLIRGLTK